MLNLYYRGSHGAIVVFDLTDKKTVDKVFFFYI
jgi:hypothetical protein